MTRPEHYGDWATSPLDPGDVQAPPVAQQQRGFRFEDIPPYQWVNWLWQIATGWSRHLGTKGGSTFDALHDAFDAPTGAPFPVGSTQFIEEDDSDGFPSSIVAEYDTDLDVVAAVTATARSVFALGHASGASQGTTVLELVRLDRDGSPTAVTYPVAGTYGAADLWSDGDIVVVASYAAVEVFDHDSGTLLWSKALTNQTRRRVAVDHQHVFVTDGDVIRRYDRADGGNAIASDQALNDWFDIATDGLFVYAVGPNNLTIYDKADGLAISTATVRSGTWPDAATITLDERCLYLAVSDGGYSFEARRRVTGGVVWTVAAPTVDDANSDDAITSCPRLRADGDAVWAVANGVWAEIDPRTGAIRSQGEHDTGTATDLGVDGCAVWVGIDDGTIARVRRGNRKRLWRRVDPTAATYLPLQQEMVPA